MSSAVTAEEILSMAAVIAFYANIFILITGLTGNCLNIILFTTLRPLQNKACGFYFFVESNVNLNQILVGLISYIVEHRFGINGISNSVAWCKIKTTAIQSNNLLFSSTICFAAFDQFLSTDHRYSVRQISTRKLAHRLIVCSICLMIAHMIPSLIFFKIRPPFLGCIIYNTIVAKYFIFFFYPVLIGLLPISATVSFSILAFYNVRHLVRRQVPTDRRQLDRQLTAMTFARVICFVILGLPYVIFRIFTANVPYSEYEPLPFAVISLVATLFGSLAYMNYVISFYIFLLASSRFRRQVKHLLMKKSCRLLKKFHVRKISRINRNQVAPESIPPNISMIQLD